MGTIALYANRVNDMPKLVEGAKKAVISYREELSALRSKALKINRAVCNLDSVISGIQSATRIQEQKIESLDALKGKAEQFIRDAGRIDDEVAEMIKRRKEDFYGKYSYMKPSSEKSGWENICSGFKNAWEWCKENWKSALSVIAVVIATVAVAVICVLSFGIAAVVISVGVGMAVGFAGQFLGDCISSIIAGEWHFSSWQTYVGATLGGGVGALALMLSCGNGTLASSIGGGVSTFFAQHLENITGGEKRSFEEIWLNTSIDAGTSALFAKFFPLKIQKITVGRGNFDAVYRGILTKLKKGIIKHVSIKTITKGVVSGVVGDFWQTLFAGTLGGLSERFG